MGIRSSLLHGTMIERVLRGISEYSQGTPWILQRLNLLAEYHLNYCIMKKYDGNSHAKPTTSRFQYEMVSRFHHDTSITCMTSAHDHVILLESNILV